MSRKIQGISMVIAGFTLLLLFLTSCKPKPIGYGVFLWGEEETSLIEGQVYPIYRESNLRDTYSPFPDDNMEREVPRWRMDLFPTWEEAEAFAAAYLPLMQTFGNTKITGAAIREKPDPESTRLYKLRKGQSVKIIEQLPEAVEIAGKEGHWFRVVTADGTMGFCFGSNFDIYDSQSPSTGEDPLLTAPILENFLTKPFRPEEFAAMALENRIDLHRFSVNQGTFPRRDEKIIKLVTAEETLTFPFDEITKLEENRFVLGGTLELRVITPDKVALLYENKGRRISEIYVALEEMNKIIEGELDRREEVFARLRRMSPGTSQAYGTIAFEELRLFRWEGYRRLVPKIIPQDAENRGSLDIRYFPAPALTEIYEGVLTFRFFSASPDGGNISFLYRQTDQGLRMVYVPPEDIEEGLVKRVSPSPLVMFFAASKTPSPEEIGAEEG